MHGKLKCGRHRKQKHGITISEVLIASLLLVSATVPILKALTSAQIASRDIDRNTNSLMLARAKIENIRAKALYSYSGSYSASGVALNGSYLCNVTDTPVSSILRKITISVGYDENGNSSLSNDEIRITLKTLIAKRA